MMLKKAYSTIGLLHDTNEMKGKFAEFFVNITIIDDGEATLSIGDLKSGILYSIPFAEILKDIKENEEKRRFGR